MTLTQRFWSKVIRRGPNDCWEWTGSGKEDYGRILIGSRKDGTRRVERATRISLQLHLGRELLPGMCALHTCDNPGCVNPAHLFEGTDADNMTDMHTKGRHPLGGAKAGESHHNVKVTLADVEAIRLRYSQGGISQVALGNEYGLSQTQVGRIIRGTRWSTTAKEKGLEGND